jgi:hypothetical protein
MIEQRKKNLRYAASVLVVMLVAGLGYGLGRLQGATVISLPPASWTGDSESAAAWRELATSMEAAGARVFAATDDPLERREGLEYLGHLLSASLEMKVARGNPAAPRFTDWMGDYRKLLGDSPDATYHTAEISSAYRYEIVGNVVDADYLGLMLYGTGLNGWNRAGANLSHEALVVEGQVPDAPYWSASLQNRWLQSLDYEHHQVSLNDAHIATADGRYRLVISHRKPAAGNWLDAAGHVEGLLAIRYQLPRGETPPPTMTLVKFDEL